MVPSIKIPQDISPKKPNPKRRKREDKGRASTLKPHRGVGRHKLRHLREAGGRGPKAAEQDGVRPIPGSGQWGAGVPIAGTRALGHPGLASQPHPRDLQHC